MWRVPDDSSLTTCSHQWIYTSIRKISLKCFVHKKRCDFKKSTWTLVVTVSLIFKPTLPDFTFKMLLSCVHVERRPDDDRLKMSQIIEVAGKVYRGRGWKTSIEWGLNVTSTWRQLFNNMFTPMNIHINQEN